MSISERSTSRSTSVSCWFMGTFDANAAHGASAPTTSPHVDNYWLLATGLRAPQHADVGKWRKRLLELVAVALVGGRQDELLAERLDRLVGCEARAERGDFEQHAA